MFTDDEAKLLDLTKLEKRLLASLDDTLVSISSLARQSKIKRTSLYSLLDHLHQRGLVSKTKRGKRFFWHLTPTRQLQEKLFALAENHRATSDPEEKELGIIASQDSEYKIYRGKKKLITIYEELGHLPRGTRLYGIQPNDSLGSVFKQVPADLIIKLNELFKQREIIVEAILAEDFLEHYVKILRRENVPLGEILTSFGSRLAITTYIPKDILNFDSELLFFGNKFIIIDWQELTAVVIKNKNIVGIMKSLFELAKLAGARVDQNPRVEKIVNNFK